MKNKLKISLTPANIPIKLWLPETNNIKFITRTLTLGYRKSVSLKYKFSNIESRVI